VVDVWIGDSTGSRVVAGWMIIGELNLNFIGSWLDDNWGTKFELQW
jgi:hypothetical protein